MLAGPLTLVGPAGEPGEVPVGEVVTRVRSAAAIRTPSSTSPPSTDAFPVSSSMPCQ